MPRRDRLSRRGRTGRGETRMLVMRFSALGDVAMTVPVVWSLARQYPDVDITVLSRGSMASVFALMPENVRFVEADFKGRHKGIAGLWRLMRELRVYRINRVADLHGVLRSHFLRIMYAMRGVRCAVIDKGRREKRRLVKRGYQKSAPLKGTLERYEDVFLRLGFPVTLEFAGFCFGDKQIAEAGVELPSGSFNVGIAPFAKHEGKAYPREKVSQLIKELLGKGAGVRIYLFGSGKEEGEVCRRIEAESEGRVVSLVGRYCLVEELMFMSRLDVMLTMDSANMHLAALTGTKVVTLWMATHPYAGFLGYGVDEELAIQLPLPCRPCSVFGNKPCRYGNYPCKDISPSYVARRIVSAAGGAAGMDMGAGQKDTASV